MKFELCDEELAGLEQELEDAGGLARLQALAEMAWHLRQRDSLRALKLIAESERRLAIAQAAGKPLPPPLAARLGLRLALAASEIAVHFCRLDEAHTQLRRARACLLGLSEVDYAWAVGDCWLVEAALAKASGERSRELQALRQAEAVCAASGDAQRAGIARGVACSEFSISQSADEHAPAASGAPVAGGPAAEAWQLAAQAFPLCLREPATAAGLFLRAAELARGMGMRRFVCIVTMNAGNAWLELGDLNNAASCFEQAAELAARTGWPVLMGTSQTQIGRVLRHLGRFEESQTVLHEALALLRVAPPGTIKAFACSELALTLLALGQAPASVAVMDEAISLYRAAQSNVNLALNLVRQARAQAQLGATEAALAAAGEAQALIERFGYTALAVELDEALAEVHRHGGAKLPPPPGMTAPSATIHFAQTALHRGMSIPGWKPPPALLAYLADAWAEADEMAQAYSYARLARLAHEQGDALKLKDPRTMLHLLGYRSLLAARASEPVAPPPLRPAAEPTLPAPGPLSAGAESLTPKEGEILQLLARNYSNKEIAQALGVSAETVKWHLKGLYGKLAAGSRRHAVTKARTLGMLHSSA
ncbi:LuxR family transcriptional regulator [Paucibacter sp. B51]|uniref:LuxR family transcriptional regulator n=1 Tax=Paucibacter sp. B51 TaxID=2993315 RepID=UPI0022EBA68E|nr:LuxR family transcriptional regulator [Paucibacter sp. B51]